MSKPAKKRAIASSATPVTVVKAKRPNNEQGSKQDGVIAMLKSPAGATIDAMMKATGWQQHSVRGFLAGIVRKKLKLNLDSKKIDGSRFYGIRGPAGIKARARQSKRRAA